MSKEEQNQAVEFTERVLRLPERLRNRIIDLARGAEMGMNFAESREAEEKKEA